MLSTRPTSCAPSTTARSGRSEAKQSNRWPDAETARLLTLYDDGLAVSEIAEELGRPAVQVEPKLEKLGAVGYLSFWERRNTAVHEAGHAVASAMRNGGDLTIRIYLDDDRRKPELGSVMHATKVKGDDDLFVTFGGLWADARHRWEWNSIHEDDGLSFEDYLADQMEHGSWGDRKFLRRCVNRLRSKLTDGYFIEMSEEDVEELRGTNFHLAHRGEDQEGDGSDHAGHS